MRFWITKGTPLSIKEQLSAQFLLGILSGRIEAGGKLPSTRELGRRLRIHPNTVSAVYRDLARRGWVANRPGSGVFVKPAASRAAPGLDDFMRSFLAAASARGFTVADLQNALARFTRPPAPRALLVADPEEAFARVLAAEISEGLGVRVGFSSIDRLLSGAPPTAEKCLLINAAHLIKLPPAISPTVIRLKAMEDVLSGQTRPARPVLIAIVSRSHEIHLWSSKLLAALGFPPESVLHRNPSEPAWLDGLAACDIVAADLLACAELPPAIHPIQFRVVSTDFIAELQTSPVPPL